MAKKPRLNLKKWIAQGYETLTAEGPGALRAEYLARIIGTTKGSFYWHFQDIETYREALLEDWSTKAVAACKAATPQGAVSGDMLRDFGKTAAFWPDSDCAEAWAEPAIRGWAYYDSAAQNAIAVVDEARFSMLRGLLNRLERGNPDFVSLYLSVAHAHIGRGTRAEEEATRILGTLTDLLLSVE